MSAKIIKGKALAAKIQNGLKHGVAALAGRGVTPGLAVQAAKLSL